MQTAQKSPARSPLTLSHAIRQCQQWIESKKLKRRRIPRGGSRGEQKNRAEYRQRLNDELEVVNSAMEAAKREESRQRRGRR